MQFTVFPANVSQLVPALGAMMRAARSGTMWWLLGLVYLAIGIATLPNYGATWDECENLYTGEAHFHYLTTWDRRYLDYSQNQLEGTEAKLYWEYSSLPERYPPATNVVAAATKHLLSDRLGWLSALDGYHSAVVALASLLVVCVASVASRRAGPLAGLVAGLALGFHPRFFSDIHNNIKDVPETVWYSLALLLMHRAHARGTLRSWAATGLCLGAALATKANALLWPGLLYLWLLLDYRFNHTVRPYSWRRSLLGAGLALVVACATAVACWPWLWADGLSVLPSRVAAYFSYVMRVSRGEQGFSLLGPSYLLAVTPPWALALSVIGIAKVVHDIRGRRDPDGFGLLLLVWIAVPVFRVCLPRARFYDGIRHFLEVLPALALLAGMGAAWLVSWLGNLVGSRRGAGFALASLAGAGSALPIASYHPHENVYFSALIGGYSGARELRLPWANEYWSGSLREAVEWIDAHGEPGFHIAALNAGHVLALLSVRPDLTLDPDPEAALNLPRRAAEGKAMRYYAIETREPYPRVSELGRLVHERLRDGAPIFRIYRIERSIPSASATPRVLKGRPGAPPPARKAGPKFMRPHDPQPRL